MNLLRGILFDWRGTLFHDEDDVDWVRASAAAIGRDFSVAQAKEVLARVAATSQHSDVVAARRRGDCSVDLNRAATLLEFRLAGYDDDLALAIWQRDGSPGVSLPYTDVPEVLAELKTCGMRIGVVSDIHYDLRPLFVRSGIAHLVDAYTLSFEHGVQKPDPRLFEIALAELGIAPDEALMVGDRASRDAGGVPLGICTLFLPPAPNFGPRGLDAVLRFAGCGKLPGFRTPARRCMSGTQYRSSAGPQARVSSKSISAGVPT